MSNIEDPQKKGEQTTTPPSQIPLLEDVVDPLSTTSEAGQKSKRGQKHITPDLDPLDKPLATDLFGDPIHSYAVNPVNDNQINEEALHTQATEVVNSLVKEYSHEIVRRLRNELTSVLNDLSEEKPASEGKGSVSSTDSEPDH